MITIEKVEAFGFEAAFRGMRNPLNSWALSSPNADTELACKLIKAGTEHRKFLRMIHIQMDVTAPIYWWKEMDTYKVGTTANSCSTMHTIHKRELTREDFSTDHLDEWSKSCLKNLLERLNAARYKFVCEGKDKAEWWQLIQLLPMSFNQKRTLDLDYETALSILRQREGHKLDEWHTFRGALLQLPHMAEFWEAVRHG